MEKRLLLAFVLSFLFLYSWSALFPKPTQKIIKPTQLIVKHEDKEIIPAPISSPNSLEQNQKLSIIENSCLKVELSNMGGLIKSITIKEFNISLPTLDFLKMPIFANDEFEIKEISNSTITYYLKKEDSVVIRKYSIAKDSYLIDANLDISGKMSKESQIEGLTLDIPSLDNNLHSSQDRSLYEYSIATDENIYRKANAFKFNPKEEIVHKGKVNWLGFRDRYFCASIKPFFGTTGFEIKTKNDNAMRIVLNLDDREETGKTKISLNSAIYYGPQKSDLLKSYNLGIEDIIKFSNWTAIDAIAKVINKIMIGLYKFIPNWGVCILLISFIIYGAMYPLTIKSMSSMKKMQSLQPRMNQIREQYKNNPQKLNKEMMDLYKEHKVNPFGGCFPLILQMPIFIGLYQVLWRSVAFKGSKFLWIKDLSEPDRLFILPNKLPIIGNEINLLPILMIFAMAFQQKISAKNMVTSDPNQVAQQKMMMTIFPVFIGFIFYKFSSGLCLYFTVFYLLSTFTQWKVTQISKVT